MPDNFCPGCGDQLPEQAHVCPTCKTLRNATGKCIACRAPMPPDAEKCTVCESYQGGRRWFDFGSSTLSAATALVSVIALSISVISGVTGRASSTRAAIVGSTKDSVLIGFINSGNNAAVVRDMSITAEPAVITVNHLYPWQEDEVKQLLKKRDYAILHYNVGSVGSSEKTTGATATPQAFWVAYGESVKIRLKGVVIESDGSKTEIDEVTTLNTIRAIVEEKCTECKKQP